MQSDNGNSEMRQSREEGLERRSVLQSLGIAGIGPIVGRSRANFTQTGERTQFVELNIVAEGINENVTQSPVCGIATYDIDDRKREIIFNDAARDKVVEAFKTYDFMAKFRRHFDNPPIVFPRNEKYDLESKTGYRLHTGAEARTNNKHQRPAIKVRRDSEGGVIASIKGNEYHTPARKTKKFMIEKKGHDFVPENSGKSVKHNVQHHLYVINNGHLDIMQA